MMQNETRKMTEQEQEETGRAMLIAALESFGGRPENPEDEDQDVMGQLVISAMVAASRAEDNAKFRMRKVDEHLYCPIQTHEVVATAFWIWSEGVDVDIETTPVRSVQGSRYLGLAQGLLAANLLSEAMDILDEGSECAFNSRGVRRFAAEY